MGDLGAVLLVDDQAAPLVSLKADVVQTKSGSVWAATNSDEDNVGVELGKSAIYQLGSLRLTHSLLLSTLCGLNADLDTSFVNLTSSNLGVELELQTLLLEDLLGLLCNLVVHTGAANLAQEFNNGNFSAEARPNGGLSSVSIAK